MANLKHAFGGQTRDLVDPYVQVSFAGLSVRIHCVFGNQYIQVSFSGLSVCMDYYKKGSSF